MNNNTGHVMRKKSTFAALIAISSLLVVLSSYYYYDYESGKLRESKHQELKAISQLKVQQIVEWHHERLGDAKLLSSSPLFNDGVERWMHNRDLALLKHDIVQRLVAPVKHYNYSDIVLVSTAGELLLSAISKPHELESTLVRIIGEAARTKNIIKTDLYACGAENAIHYDFVAPLVDDNDKTIALLVLRRDPNLVLYPLIQSWPTPSLTSETVIARRDGDSVIILNELRHKANTALKVRFPLTMTELPTVKAVLGHEGIFEGKDYRGIEVLTDISRVPETPWVMIAKIDQSEVYAGLKTTATVIAGFGVLTILVISVGFSLIYNSRQKNIYP